MPWHVASPYSDGMLRSLVRVCFLFMLAPVAWAGQITLILSDASVPYQEFASHLQRHLGNDWRITHTVTLPDTGAGAQADLIVTAGSNAFRRALATTSSLPILAALLPEHSYYSILGEFPGTPRVSAVFLDQPPARQAQFVRLLLPEARKISVLSSERARFGVQSYQAAFASRRLQLINEEVVNERDIVPTLESLLGRSDALLAVPDALVYARDSVRPLLMTAYRYRRPVIGFSAALVKAGALAALYATPSQIGRQAGRLISTHGNRLPPPRGPAEFALSINQSVADALGLRLPEESDLFQKLQSSGMDQ